MVKQTHEVLRPFDAGKRHLKPGDHVDASSWRNTRQLVACRYLAPLVGGVPQMPEVTTEVIK